MRRRIRYLTVLALAVYGIDRERALAYAIVLYAVAAARRVALLEGIPVLGLNAEVDAIANRLLPSEGGSGQRSD